MAAVPPGLAAALQDRYRLERELGQGGMATVYLAHDLRNNRPVALKVLRPELAAILGAERFLKEIETTANLQHPHILPLFDSGVAVGGHGSWVGGHGSTGPATHDSRPPSLHPSILPSVVNRAAVPPLGSRLPPAEPVAN
jgi:serine/threonine protein kinase